MWPKTLFITISFFFVFCSVGISQTKLRGVVNGLNGDAIAYATVTLQQEGHNNPEIHQTNAQGQFIFKNLKDEIYSLSVYAFGFSQYKIMLQVNRDTTLQIQLRPLEETLKGITVTGEKPAIERKPDRVIFNVNNNISAAGSNGVEMLKKIPGINIINNSVSLAGRGEMGIMVNGRILHLSEKTLINYLRSYAADQVEKIEVITHPSAQYDAEGNAGLINIITKRSTKAGWSGNISGAIKKFFYKNQPDYKGIKNYGDIDGGLDLNYNKGKWSAYTNVSYSAGRELWGYGIGVHHPDKFWDMEDTGEYRIATFNILTGADYHLSRNTSIGLEYNYNYHIEDGADYVHVPIYNNSGNLDSTISTYATYLPIAKSNGLNLHLIQKLNDNGALLKLNADYFNFYRHDRSDLYTSKGKQVDMNNAEILYDTTLQNIMIYTFKADASLPTSFAQFNFGGKLSFINNYSDIYYYHNISGKLLPDSSLSNQFRYIENTQAIYANVAKDIDNWKVEAGLRAELTQTKATSYFEDSTVKQQYLKLFPNVLVGYDLNENNSFALNYNKRIHRPTFWNLNPYKTFMTPYTYVEGYPYLKPEYITNIRLSHDYKNILSSAIYINIINNGFSRIIKAQNSGPYTHITTMRNFIKSNRYGISESVTLNPVNWYETYNTFTGYYTKVNSNINYINGISGWGAYLSTANTFYFNADKTFSGYLGFWYQFPEIDNFGKSDTYYNVDLGLQMLALQKRLSVSLNFSDIFQSSASKVTTIVDNIKSTYTNFQLNSQIRLSATWSFGRTDIKKKSIDTGNEAERSRVN